MNSHIAKKTLSKNKWEDLENAIWDCFGQRQHLLIDGYKVSIRLCISRKCMSIKIKVYVNGTIDIKWIEPDSEIGQRFLMKKTKWLRTKHEVAQKQKQLGKRLANQLNIKPESYYSYFPYYSSFKTLKNTLERNNDSIEWIEDDKLITPSQTI